MASFIKFERPMLIRDAAGNLVFEHAAFARMVEDVKNASTTTAIGRGEAVILDTGNGSLLPRWDYSALGATDVDWGGVNVPGSSPARTSPCVLAGLRVASAASKLYLGVAMENIPAGVTGHVCTDGISAVKCVSGLAAGSTTGSRCVGSATAGSMDGAGAVTVVPNGGLTLGTIYVLNGTSAGQMGSTTQLGVLINPV